MHFTRTAGTHTIRHHKLRGSKVPVPISGRKPTAKGMWNGAALFGSCRAGSLVEMVGDQAMTPFPRESR